MMVRDDGYVVRNDEFKGYFQMNSHEPLAHKGK